MVDDVLSVDVLFDLAFALTPVVVPVLSMGNCFVLTFLTPSRSMPSIDTSFVDALRTLIARKLSSALCFLAALLSDDGSACCV